jgi:hypothetical protein
MALPRSVPSHVCEEDLSIRNALPHSARQSGV